MCISKVLERKKTCIFTSNLTFSIFSDLQDLETKGVKSSKHLGCLQFYTKQVVSNFHLHVLYREQRHIIFYGNATNWNSAGYADVYHELCKHSVKCLTNSVTVSPGKVKINDQKLFYITQDLEWEMRHFENFTGLCKPD
jgi:hypothetical protein